MENDKMYDFYLAGPFFNENQIKSQEMIEKMFKDGNKVCFSPRLDAGTLGTNPSKSDMLKVFYADLEAIDKCRILFANVSFRDTGTSVEIGYALAKHTPVVLFWDKENHDVGHVNLMIALACDGNVIQSREELEAYIKTNTLPDADFWFKVE